MRPAVDGSPTVEADTVPGCLDRLTLAGCTDEVEGLDRRPSIYMSLLYANDHVPEKTSQEWEMQEDFGYWAHGETIAFRSWR